jgi:hypothetical protein
MATNVRGKVLLKVRVSEIHDTSGPKEGKQWHLIHKCWTGIISNSEMNWRFQAAQDILCGGETDYTSYGDAIGDGWI